MTPNDVREVSDTSKMITKYASKLQSQGFDEKHVKIFSEYAQKLGNIDGVAVLFKSFNSATGTEAENDLFVKAGEIIKKKEVQLSNEFYVELYKCVKVMVANHCEEELLDFVKGNEDISMFSLQRFCRRINEQIEDKKEEEQERSRIEARQSFERLKKIRLEREETLQFRNKLQQAENNEEGESGGNDDGEEMVMKRDDDTEDIIIEVEEPDEDIDLESSETDNSMNEQAVWNNGPGVSVLEHNNELLEQLNANIKNLANVLSAFVEQMPVKPKEKAEANEGKEEIKKEEPKFRFFRDKRDITGTGRKEENTNDDKAEKMGIMDEMVQKGYGAEHINYVIKILGEKKCDSALIKELLSKDVPKESFINYLNLVIPGV